MVLVTPKPTKTEREEPPCVFMDIDQTILTDDEAQLQPNHSLESLPVGIVVCMIIISYLVHHASYLVPGVWLVKMFVFVFVSKRLELNNNYLCSVNLNNIM